MAQVLSHTQYAPAARAIAEIRATSVTASVGFDGVSIQMSRVCGATAAATAAGSVMSTSVLPSPQPAITSRSNFAVP